MLIIAIIHQMQRQWFGSLCRGATLEELNANTSARLVTA
jgi:hypothetical protein